MTNQALEKKLLPLVCSGDPFTRGSIQGESLKKQLRLFFNAFFQSDVYQLFKPHWLPNSLALKWLNFSSLRSYKALIQEEYPDYIDFLIGLANGSHESLDKFLLMCVIEDLMAHYNCSLDEGTILAIPPSLSASEELFLVKNFDCPYFLLNHHFVRKTRPKRGLATIELAMLPMAGCQMGLNEAGVAIACNYGYAKSSLTKGVPLHLRIQEALRTCSSAEEVIAFFEDTKHSVAALISVVDARGLLYSIELLDSRMSTKKIVNNLLINTNHFQLSDMLKEDMPTKAYYPTQHLPELSQQRIRESSELRFDRLNELTGTKILFYEEDLYNYFSDHNRDGIGTNNTICRHGSYYETVYSVVIKPQSREMLVALGSPCEVEYQSFSL